MFRGVDSVIILHPAATSSVQGVVSSFLVHSYPGVIITTLRVPCLQAKYHPNRIRHGLRCGVASCFHLDCTCKQSIFSQNRFIWRGSHGVVSRGPCLVWRSVDGCPSPSKFVIYSTCEESSTYISIYYMIYDIYIYIYMKDTYIYIYT